MELNIILWGVMIDLVYIDVIYKFIKGYVEFDV